MKYSSNPSWCKPTTVAEIRGLIGILYVCAAKKYNHNAEVLWDPASRSVVYRAVMPLQSYRFFLQCLTFDNKSMRDKEDPFVHIRDCGELYSLLFSFRSLHNR
jgi:hypothetical protein